MTAPFSLRHAVARDTGALTAFARDMFRATFNHYEPDALDHYLAEHYATTTAAKFLSTPDRRVWIAEGADGTIIGYTIWNRCALPAPASPDDAELARLYVSFAHHSRGVGRALLHAALDEARAEGFRRMHLGVWEHNLHAQVFYAQQGFVKIGEYDYTPIGEVHDREWIMSRSL